MNASLLDLSHRFLPFLHRLTHPFHFERDMSQYEQFIKYSYAISAPLMAVRLFDCGYLMFYSGDPAFEVPTGVYFESPAFANRTKANECVDIGVVPKVLSAP